MSDVHTCGYYCDRPRCIKEQRDELRDRFQIMQAQAEVDAKAQRKVQAQAQEGDGEAAVAWLKPAHELVENSVPDVITTELRSATIARGGMAASCMENYSVPLYPRPQPAVNQQLLEALKDARSALRYVRETHGELYGVGFDRVEKNSTAAIAAAQEQSK